MIRFLKQLNTDPAAQHTSGRQITSSSPLHRLPSLTSGRPSLAAGSLACRASQRSPHAGCR
ncbi:hypothetical protein E2C01_046503 [Portunus trituberculatus]|uniref:Uncharacterized protein n=1 Tax=Portunus trituberculatus TaxID=210409 RepID=A0A5B7FYS7_PORTR|nr:hypothetical protein [Portunus trituberculatus]